MTTRVTATTGKLDSVGNGITGTPIKSGDGAKSYGVRFSDENNWVARANRKKTKVTRNKLY